MYGDIEEVRLLREAVEASALVAQECMPEERARREREADECWKEYEMAVWINRYAP